MAGSTPFNLAPNTQAAFIEFERQCFNSLTNQWNLREQMRSIDLAYMRENDRTKANNRARTANYMGDSTKFQNITVPIVLPQVESAVTYQSSVFLTGTPIFGWVADPANEDAALQYQAITEENSIRGAWVQQIMMFFRDGFKYNISLLECVWDRVTTAAIETDVSFAGGREGKPKKVIWEGNCIRRWDPYNSFWDMRCEPTKLSSEGEFAGRVQLMSRIRLKHFMQELSDKMIQNVKDAFASGFAGISTANIGASPEYSYYIPQLNPLSFATADPRITMDWMAWAGLAGVGNKGIRYQNLYEVTTLYARILPSDFDLRVPSANTPQIWKLIIVNHQVLIYAERQTNVHDLIPVFIGQPNEDGLGYQTKSLAVNAQSFQEVGSALVNSAMAARRRAISDRGIYDPSRISEAHINSDNPSAKIPLRAAGYNKPINEAYFPIPFRDDQSPIAFSELAQIMQMANIVGGQNPAKQGQFVKGNKTLHEYESVMSNANGRDQMTSMLLEGQVFTPLKEVLKTNILQYQAAASIYSPSQQRVVKIDPIVLRQSFATYTITDGLTPTDKAISGDVLGTAIQMMATSPVLGAGYNIAPAFSYLMKTQNADLSPFEKSPAQVAYETAANQWQEIAMQAVKSGADASKLPPQPKPQDYGYIPGQLAQSKTAQSPAPTNVAASTSAQNLPASVQS